MRDVSIISNDAILNFKFCRCRAYIDDLVRDLHKFVEIERTIIERTRQAKAVIYQHGLAGAVTFIHAADLRDGGVRLINHHQKILREKVDDRVRLGTRRTSRQMARVIFNPVAEPHFLQHLQIVFRAHPQPLRF